MLAPRRETFIIVGNLKGGRGDWEEGKDGKSKKGKGRVNFN